MRTIYFTIVAVLLGTVMVSAQDGSIETFNAIRLEHSTNQGQYVTLSAPSGVTSYNLTLPATGPSNTSQRWAFSLNGSSNALSWYPTPLGTANQLAFFNGAEEVISTSNLTWDNTNKLLSVSATTTGTGTLFSVSKASTAMAMAETVMNISSTSVPPGGNDSLTKTLLNISATGNMGNKSVVKGLVVSATGGNKNYAAVFSSGNVGVGVSAPNTTMDVDGDVSWREYNYTTNLSTTNNNMDFDGVGNKHSFIRIGSSTTADFNITGLKGGCSGKMVTLYNATGHGMRLKHESTNSTDTNRINTAADADVLLIPGAAYQLIWSAIDKRWVVAFSGPGELTSLGNKEIQISGGGETLPSTTASYIQINTPTTTPNRYGVYLADGVNPGQILVIQNKGPKTIYFLGTNVVWDNTTDLQDGESIIAVWNGTAWVQVARASN